MSCLLASFLASLISMGVLPQASLDDLGIDVSGQSEGACEIAPPPSEGNSDSGSTDSTSDQTPVFRDSKPGTRDRIYNGF